MSTGKHVTIFLIVCVVWCAAASEPEPRRVYTGINVSTSLRRGYFHFPGDRIQDTALAPLVLGGVRIGRIWSLNRTLHLDVGLIGEIGQSINDTTSAYGSPMELRYQYTHMACVPRLLATLDIAGTARPFVSVGAGFHSMQIVEKIFSLGSDDIYWGDIEDHTLSGSVSGGFGFEIFLSRKYRLMAAYSLRYWQPLRYDFPKDLFTGDVPYSELFLTHAFRAALLIDLSVGGSFF